MPRPKVWEKQLIQNHGQTTLRHDADVNAWFVDTTDARKINKYRPFIEDLPYIDEPNHLAGYLNSKYVKVDIIFKEKGRWT